MGLPLFEIAVGNLFATNQFGGEMTSVAGSGAAQVVASFPVSRGPEDDLPVDAFPVYDGSDGVIEIEILFPVNFLMESAKEGEVRGPEAITTISSGGIRVISSRMILHPKVGLQRGGNLLGKCLPVDGQGIADSRAWRAPSKNVKFPQFFLQQTPALAGELERKELLQTNSPSGGNLAGEKRWGFIS